MMELLRAKYVHLAIAVSTLVVAMLLMVVMPLIERSLQCWEISVWIHVCLLQITGGVFLLAGSIKGNHWLYLPWLVATIIFTYTLIYKTLSYFAFMEGKTLVLVLMCDSIAGFWCYFIYDVFSDFLKMYSDSKLQSLTKESKKTGSVVALS
ncbi:hypothetical protein KR018_003086 [Drosophila ironensis]|nr:hypothetical protein KR018_003086 [Drosophila ironensis]